MHKEENEEEEEERELLCLCRGLCPYGGFITVMGFILIQQQKMRRNK